MRKRKYLIPILTIAMLFGIITAVSAAALSQSDYYAPCYYDYVGCCTDNLGSVTHFHSLEEPFVVKNPVAEDGSFSITTFHGSGTKLLSDEELRELLGDAEFEAFVSLRWGTCNPPSCPQGQGTRSYVASCNHSFDGSGRCTGVTLRVVQRCARCGAFWGEVLVHRGPCSGNRCTHNH